MDDPLDYFYQFESGDWDEDWLEQNIDAVLEGFRIAINTERLWHRAIKVASFFDRPICYKHRDKIKPILVIALMRAVNSKANKDAVQIRHLLAVFQFIDGKPSNAKEILEIAANDVSELNDLDLALLIRIEVLRTLALPQGTSIRDDLILGASQLAANCEEPNLKYHLFATLAHVYGNMDNRQEAERYGRQALNYWEMTRNYEEGVRTALILTAIFRQEPIDVEKAELYLNKGFEFWDKFNEGRFGVALAYEKASFLFELGQFSQAYEWYEKANEAYEALSERMPQRTASLQHSLGKSLIRIQKYDKAVFHLDQAFLVWTKIGDVFQQADFWFEKATIAYLSGDFAEAKNLAQSAAQQCYACSPSAKRNKLLSSIQQLIDDCPL